MKRWIHAASLPTEESILKQIPRRCKQHIESIEVSLSDDYNDRGQQLRNYTVTWDNGDEHTFQNLQYMIESIKECTTEDGYYDAD